MMAVRPQLRVLLTFVICFFFACGNNSFVRRSRNGDKLFAEGLDCSLHNSTGIGNNTCSCGSSGSYYTDKNNVTKCFQGRGAEESGKETVVRLFNVVYNILFHSIIYGIYTRYVTTHAICVTCYISVT